MSNSKAQVSLFIIIGLVLLLIIAMFFYIEGLQIDKIDDELEVDIQDSQSMQKYVEQCLKDVSVEAVRGLAMKGGSFDPVQWKYVNFDKGDEGGADGEIDSVKVNMLCYADGDNPCVQTLVTKSDLEIELSKRIAFILGDCLDIGNLESQGVSIATGEKLVDPTITDGKVMISMYYPIQVSMPSTSYTVNDFSAEVDEPLGELFKLALIIMNEENTNGFFDQVEFMETHTDFVIKKQKPYPSTVYTLRKDGLIFNFVIQGVDTVSQAGTSGFNMHENKYGCCYLRDNFCYANTPADVCELKQGVYEPGPCSCPEVVFEEDVLCNNRACGSCALTYNYVSKDFDNPRKEHGESWCVYESIVGQGLDYVGSRHYMHYCMDGIEYVEPARDYREELCTEGIGEIGAGGNSGSVASIRVNRWQDCSRCTTEDCCSDINLRDCVWKDWLDTENKCSPEVPPGFRHWEFNGMDVCNFANEEKYCDGFSCPNKWIDDSAIYCYSQGDCGNYRNTADKLTEYGFFNSDMSDKVRDYVYLDKGNIDFGHNYVLGLPLDTRDQAELAVSPFAISADNIIRLISVGYQYIDELSYLSISDLLNPFTEKPDLEILDVSFCSVWQAPNKKSDCDLCVGDLMHPCTEYKCKSLGMKCVFKEEMGVPSCVPKETDDNKAPVVSFDFEALSSGYNAEASVLDIHGTEFKGYNITPELEPFKVFNLGIITDEKTVCRLDATPNIPYINFPVFNFGDYTYSTSHNLTLRVPPMVEAPTKIMEVLNITTLTELLESLDKPKELLQEYEERFSFVFSAYKLVTGDDLTNLIEPFVGQIIGFIDLAGDLFPFYEELITTIISKFESSGYYLFVKCYDEAGNVNTEDFYIDLTIGDLKNDTEAPVVVKAVPGSGVFVANDLMFSEVLFYLNEPSECRYDYSDKTFEDMLYSFDCVSSVYDIHPVEGGTYPCKTELGLEIDEQVIYVRCKDHPREKEAYELNIERDIDELIYGVEASRYADVSSDVLFVSSNMIRSGTDLVFHVKEDDLGLVFYQEEDRECSLSYGEDIDSIGNCESIDELDLGFYQCGTEFSLETEEEDRNVSFVIEFENSSVISVDDGFTLNETTAILNINYAEISSSSVISTNLSKVYFNLTMPEIFDCVYNSSPITEIVCYYNGKQTNCYGGFDLGVKKYNVICTNFTEMPIPNLGRLYEYNITCEDSEELIRNVNVGSYVYTLYKSKPLEIVSVAPDSEEVEENVALTVFVSESKGVKCSYSSSLSSSYLNMREIAENAYHARLIGLEKGAHHYLVRCEDGYGNMVEDDVTFYVV